MAYTALSMTHFVNADLENMWQDGIMLDEVTKFLESSLELSHRQMKDFHRAAPNPLSYVRLLAQTWTTLQQIAEANPMPFFPE